METVINRLISVLRESHDLAYALENKEFWINKAKEEAGFIPKEGDWIHVEVTRWKIAISVYHENSSGKDSRYWINGAWYTTPFPEFYPSI